MLGAKRSEEIPRPAVAWAVYDLAYSLFTFIVVIRFLPAWIIDDLERPDWYVSVTQVGVVISCWRRCRSQVRWQTSSVGASRFCSRLR